MGDPHIFISYAAQDKGAALEVCEALESTGLTCWIAPRDIRAGKLYAEEIISALHDCRIVVVLLSSSSNASPHVAQEIDRAFSQGREILVLRVEDVEARGALEYYLSGRQWLDALSLPLKPHLIKLCQRASDILGGRQQSQGEKPDRGFCLPWPSKDRFSAKIRNAAVLVTNIHTLTSADLSQLVEQCRNASKTLVVVAPILESSVVQVVKSLEGVAIEAKDLKGQPMDELLWDLGTYLDGRVMLRELGFGLPVVPGRKQEVVNGIFCPYLPITDVKLEGDLGAAQEVWTDTKNACFESEHTAPYVDARIRELKYRVSYCAASHDEYNGPCERLRRFGVVEPIRERLIRVSFTQTADEVILPVGFASPFFVTEPEDFRCEFKGAKTLVTTRPLDKSDVIMPALVQAAHLKEITPLVVFAPKIREEALAMMVVNKLRGTVLTLGVETSHAEQLAAIADLTGAELIDESNAERLFRASFGRLFGNAREVVSEFHRTTVRR